MKKVFLPMMLTLALVGTSAYAYGNKSSQCDKKEGYSKNKSAMMHQKKDCFKSMMHSVAQLNLSDAQWMEVKKTMLEMKIDNLDASKPQGLQTYFKGDSFDKKSFVEDKTKAMTTQIQNKAAAIEKITELLNKEQLEQFKQNLEQPYQKQSKQGKNDKKFKKSCNK